MAKRTEYSIGIQVEGGKAAAQVFDSIGESATELARELKKVDDPIDDLKKELKALGGSADGTEDDLRRLRKQAIDTAQGMGKLGDEAQDAGDDVQQAGNDALGAGKGFNSLAQNLTGLNQGFQLLGQAVAIAASPFEYLNERITETGRLVSQAALYDVDAGFLSQTVEAAKFAGAELDDVLDVIRDVRERTGEALAELAIGNEVNTFVTAFKAIGVAKDDIQDFASDTELIFDTFYDKIGESMRDGNAEIQFRLQELSSAGYEKIGPVVAAGFRLGAQNAEEFRQAMVELGVTLSSRQTAQIAGIGSDLKVISTVFEGMKNQILIGLAPALERLTKEVADVMRSFGVGESENPFKQFGEWIGEALDKAREWIKDFAEDPEGTLRAAADNLGNMFGEAMVDGMISGLGMAWEKMLAYIETLPGYGLVTGILGGAAVGGAAGSVVPYVGTLAGAVVGGVAGGVKSVYDTPSAEQSMTPAAGQTPVSMGPEYEAAVETVDKIAAAYDRLDDSYKSIVDSAKNNLSLAVNTTTEINAAIKAQEIADNASKAQLESGNEFLRTKLEIEQRYSGLRQGDLDKEQLFQLARAKQREIQLAQWDSQRAAARTQLLNTKELLAAEQLITDQKANQVLAVAALLEDGDIRKIQLTDQARMLREDTMPAYEQLLANFDAQTVAQRGLVEESINLQYAIEDVARAEDQAANSAQNWTGILTSGINGATNSLGGLISGLGQLLGIDLSGLGSMFNGLFSGSGGGRGGQIANVVLGGIGAVGQMIPGGWSGLFGGGGPQYGVPGGAIGPPLPPGMASPSGANSGWIGSVGDWWGDWGGAISGVAAAGMGIYGLVTGGGGAGAKASGAVDIASTIPTLGQEIGKAAGLEFAKQATGQVSLGAYGAQYSIPSIVGGVLAAVLGGPGAEIGAKVSMAGGIATGAGTAAMAGFNALGGSMASGAAPILGQAGAILGPTGSILGAAGGGIVIGGKIGEQFDKGNYGTEASDAGMIGGAVGGAAGAGVAIAAGAGAAAASMMGAAAGGTMAAVIGGLAVTGIGLIAAAVLALVFALVGDAIAHTPLLGRQVDDTLRATVLDADNFESLRGFKEETGVGFQNLMTTKKTGTGQGQITGGEGEKNVRADLLAAGFSAEEVEGIMGTGTGYGYLAGGVPFDGAGGLRKSGDEFGMRRSKDDRGAAMMYEANYIGSEQVRMIYANAVRTFKEQGKSNEEAIDAANDVVSQHLAELGFDIKGALLAFDDQLFIAQSSMAGITGAGTNENGRNEADLARRMQFAADGTMAQGMIDAANSWDTLFADSIPQGLTGLDLLLVGMGETAFQTEEVAKATVQAAIEAGGEAEKQRQATLEDMGAMSAAIAAMDAEAATGISEMTDEARQELVEASMSMKDEMNKAPDYAFDTERANDFLEAWAKSAAVVGQTLPAILMSGDVEQGISDLVDQTAANIGGQLREAMNESFSGAISSLMDERGGIAGGLHSLTSLLNADLTTEEGRELVMANLPQAIADSKASLEQYIPTLKYMADAQAEVNDQIDVAIGLMTEEDALIRKANRDRTRDSEMGADWEAAKTENFMIDLFVGRENRGAYRESLEELGKEGADAYWQAIIDSGGDRAAVDAFLQAYQDALTESEKLKTIGDMIGNSVGDGIARALTNFAVTGDMDVLKASLEQGVNEAVFNGFLQAALQSGPITALIRSVAERQSAAYQLMTGAGMDPAEIAAQLKADALRQINEGMAGVEAQLGYLPALAEELGIDLGPSTPTPTPTPTPTAPTGPAARNDLSYEQIRYEMGEGFIGSLGSYGGLAIEQQQAMLNGERLNVESQAQQTRNWQLEEQRMSRALMQQMVDLLRSGEISREEFNDLLREQAENPGTFVLEIDGDQLDDVITPRPVSNSRQF